MKIQKITQAQTKTTQWSGGKTTQFAIYPPQCDYAARDFLWRVSSATVELEESDFTALPDYVRYISTLHGQMTLRHGNEPSITLNPLEVDYFDGGVPTHSWGKCRDFNLMLRKGQCDGKMEKISLAPGKTRTVCAEQKTDCLLYVREAQASLRADGKGCTLDAGQSLLVSLLPGEALTLTAECAWDGILCTMRYI